MGPGRFWGVPDGFRMRWFLSRVITGRDRPKQLKEACGNVLKTMFFDVVFDAPGLCFHPEVFEPFLLLGVFEVTHASN